MLRVYKAIFHIDELKKWKLLLGNVQNLLNALESSEFEIEVLANAEAVKYYKTSISELEVEVSTMKNLNERGVKFVACNNALKKYELQKDDLFDFVKIVPAGVLELIKKQAEGFAYIKP